MTKKLFFAFSWMFLSIGVILISSATVQHTLTKQNKVIPPEETYQQVEAPILDTQPILVAQTPPQTGEVKGIETVLESDDARVEIVANFLERYKSPLKPYTHYAEVFVDLADKNSFDFRLLPAIAMQESNLCKVIPENSYNCLGFGVHSRGTLTFENFEANFERAARELKKNYIDIGLTTPEKIMTKYTPHSNGSWANSVNQWMAEMKYDSREKGKALKQDANVLEYAQD